MKGVYLLDFMLGQKLTSVGILQNRFKFLSSLSDYLFTKPITIPVTFITMT